MVSYRGNVWLLSTTLDAITHTEKLHWKHPKQNYFQTFLPAFLLAPFLPFLPFPPFPPGLSILRLALVRLLVSRKAKTAISIQPCRQFLPFLLLLFAGQPTLMMVSCQWREAGELGLLGFWTDSVSKHNKTGLLIKMAETWGILVSELQLVVVVSLYFSSSGVVLTRHACTKCCIRDNRRRQSPLFIARSEPYIFDLGECMYLSHIAWPTTRRMVFSDAR